jgi:hypothetical protein
LINWFYNNSYTNESKLTVNLSREYLSEIPICEIASTVQKPFLEVVDKIISITKSGDYLQNSTKQAQVKVFEKQIDQMVYKLYDLTEEEIRIIEGKSSGEIETEPILANASATTYN